MDHQDSTKVTVKKVKEFLLGRHIALAGTIIVVLSTFLDWATAEGVAIKGFEAADSKIIIAVAVVAALLLFFKKFYKVTILLALLLLAIVGSHYVEVSGPMEVITDDGALEILGKAGIGLYLAIAGGVLATVGTLIQIFKK
jgi:hypothetical protein